MQKQREIAPLTKADKAFFQSFYTEYKRLLFREAAACAATASERDDLMQEALVRLMKNISVLRNMTRHKTAYYIAVTVKTTYVDMIRLRHEDTVFSLNDDSILKLVNSEKLVHRSQPDLSEKLAVIQLKESLPERDWLVLVGKYMIGYTHEELSALLGIQPDSVKTVLRRAKAKARDLLRQDDQEGSGQIE